MRHSETRRSPDRDACSALALPVCSICTLFQLQGLQTVPPCDRNAVSETHLCTWHSSGQDIIKICRIIACSLPLRSFCLAEGSGTASDCNAGAGRRAAEGDGRLCARPSRTERRQPGRHRAGLCPSIQLVFPCQAAFHTVSTQPCCDLGMAKPTNWQVGCHALTAADAGQAS